MATLRGLKLSFNAGELSPELAGRVDDTKNQAGLAACRNFIPRVQGPVENRPGFAFVRAVKDSTKRTRLIPFTFSTTQTMVIEISPGFFRFHTQGGTLLDGGNPYEVANPYAEADLFDINYVQSADVLTLVHPNHAPRELRRLGAVNWTLTTPTFGAPITPPTGGSAVASGQTADKYTYSYVVTAIAADGIGESVASTPASDMGNLFETGCTVLVSWSAVAGASRYKVYKLQGGLYGYIGQTDTLSITDDNITPDLGITPPLYDTVFGSAGNYPSAVSYYEQRRVFAGTLNDPSTIWMTKSGTESNVSYTIPIQDDNRIRFRVAAREANAIRHLVPLGQLLLLTSSAEWATYSVNSDAITPTSLAVRPQSFIGANGVQPVIVNSNLIYCASRGGHVREASYQRDANGYITGDICIRAAHLFDNKTLADMAYSKAPQTLVWFVSSDGRLLSLTYNPDNQVGAWARHDTDGVFESVAVVAEGDEDYLYCVIRRTVNGASVRYVERMASRQFVDLKDAFFVDSGLKYTGAPVTILSGLGHLEGKTVNILADGAVHPQRTVTGGAITLETPASTVIVGLPITADLETLPLALQLQDGSFGTAHFKNVNKVTLRVLRSAGVFVGPNVDSLVEFKQRQNEPYDTPPDLRSSEIEVVLTPSWADSGSVVVRQTAPLPLSITNMVVHVALGG